MSEREPAGESGFAPLAIAVALSVLAFGYGVQSVLHDLGELHVRNPQWPGHARMHVVWMLALSFLLAALVCGLAWWPGAGRAQRQLVAAILNVLPFLSFVMAWGLSATFGGSISDGTVADVEEATSNATSFALGLPVSLALLLWCHLRARSRAGDVRPAAPREESG